MRQDHLERMLGFQAQDYIKVYDDFLTPEQCKALIDRYEASPFRRPSSDDHAQQAGNREYREGELLRVSKTPGMQAEDRMIYDAVGRVIQRYLGETGLEGIPLADTGYTIAKFNPGDKTHYHADTMPAGRAYRCLSLVAYLNDVAEGGETVFPHQRRWVTPKVGRVAIFPAGFTHRHYANPAATERYIVVSFFEAIPPRT